MAGGRELRIVHWALMLRWPKEESIGPGISVFELAENYLGVVGSPMPGYLESLHNREGCGATPRFQSAHFRITSKVLKTFGVQFLQTIWLNLGKQRILPRNVRENPSRGV